MNALQTLQIGKEIEVRTMYAGETFLFEFKDGSFFVLSFESGNLLKNGVCYETKGYTMLQQLIKNYYEKNVSLRQYRTTETIPLHLINIFLQTFS